MMGNNTRSGKMSAKARMEGGGLMRQGQQNRRNRGRGRNRTGNPLTKSYESNGPDVKIKGTAADIAQKYMTLARDQLSMGNTVAAESYLQHAEHYNRIIMAAQSKQDDGPQQPGRPHNGVSRLELDEMDDDYDDGDDEAGAIPGYGDQPVIDVEVAAVGAAPAPAPALLQEDSPRRRMGRPRRQRERSEPAEGEAKEGGQNGNATQSVGGSANNDPVVF